MIAALFNRRNSQMIEAAKTGKVEQIQKLVSKGAKIDCTDKFGLTPLHLASENGHLNVVKWLVSNGAKIDGAI